MIQVNDTSVSLFLLTLVQSISETDEAGNYVSDWTLLSGLGTDFEGAPDHLTFIHDKTGELALFELKYHKLQTPHWQERVLTDEERNELMFGGRRPEDWEKK